MHTIVDLPRPCDGCDRVEPLFEGDGGSLCGSCAGFFLPPAATFERQRGDLADWLASPAYEPEARLLRADLAAAGLL